MGGTCSICGSDEGHMQSWELERKRPFWRRRLPRYNAELNDLYSSPNIVRVIKSRRIRWAGYVAPIGEERGVCRVLLGKPEGRRPLGRTRRRWVDNRTDLQEVGCWYMDWIGLAQIGTVGGRL